MKEEDYSKKTFYKYRSLENFKHFMDVVVNNRLHGSMYSEMNDYMEGHYLYNSGNVSKQIIDDLKKSKEQVKICSLSKVCDNEVMLAHYANGGKGVVLGVKVADKDINVQEVKYEGIRKFGEKFGEINYSDDLTEKAKVILTHKTESWRYESEVRVFTHKGDIKIELKEIIFGPRVKDEDKKLIENIVKRMKLDIKLKKWRSDVESNKRGV